MQTQIVYLKTGSPPKNKRELVSLKNKQNVLQKHWARSLMTLDWSFTYTLLTNIHIVCIFLCMLNLLNKTR